MTQRRRRSPLVASLLAALLVIGGLPGVAYAATTTLTLAPAGTVVSMYGDAPGYSATLVDPAGPTPVQDASISFDAVPFGGGSTVPLGSATTDATGVATLGANPVTSLGAGHWLISAHWAGNGTWDANDSPSTNLTVDKATLTVTPDADSVAYGSPPPDYTKTVTGFIIGENAGNAAGYVAPTCGSEYDTSSPAGTPLTITCTGGSATNYAFDTKATAVLTITKATQAITFTSTAPSAAAVGGTTYTPTATATSGLAITFSIAAGSSGVCTIAGGIVSFIGAGTCTVNADQAGNANWNAAPQAQQSFAIGAGNQTITFAALGGKTFGNAPFTVSASASSGLAVTFSSLTLPVCTVSGSTVTILAAGTCTVRASQGGNPTWNPATPVDQSFTVAKAGQTITFSQPGNKVYGDAPYTPTATASSRLTVTFSSTTPAVCTSDGTTVTIVGAGTCTLVASQVGNANYNAAPDVARSLAVSKKAVVVTANAKSRLYGAPDPTFDATLTGLVGADNPGTPDCTTTPDAPKVDGGIYPITCTGASLSTANYTYTFQPGTLTITAAPLTVTADNKARQYGLPNPPLTATVSGFVNGETPATARVTGDASCTTGALVTDGVGSHAISCARGTLAAPNYDFPTFVGGTLLITQALAAPALVADVNPAPVSAVVTFTATVTWPTGTPTGSVTFFEGGADLSGPVTLDGTGKASFATSALPVGSHEIIAVYSGDGANFGQATSAAFTQVVGKSAVNVVLTANRTTWETKVPITFTATLAPNASGVTVPVTGTVTFTVDGVVRATVPVANGTASYASPALASGSHTVLASYVPDVPGSDRFNGGASAPLTRKVVANTVSASGVGVSGTSVYPYRDTWRDTVSLRGTRVEPLSVSIAIYSPTGRKVRSASFGRKTGVYAMTWNGRTSSGRTLAAGRYRVVQVLADAYGTRKTYTSYVTLSRKRMYWYAKTLTVSPGPRHFAVAGNAAIQAQYSTTRTGSLVMSNATAAPAWVAVGYQFSLPAATTYRSLSFQVRGSWTGATAPKIGIIPWSGGWGSMYSLTRARATMGTSTTAYYAQTLSSLGGIVSRRSVRAAIDSFAAPSGYGAGPFRYSITAVRLVVRYGILK